MPKVSVILPVYNCDKYIGEAIESILNQTFTDFELLIINDGSTDKSLEIIESFSDARIRVHTNSVNLKLIASLNLGLNLAQGEYIARMDADDISHPERLAKQCHYLDQHADCVLVGSNCNMIGDYSGKSNFPLTDLQIRVRMLFENPMAHPTVMFRNKVCKLHNLSYRPELLHLEDWGFWYDFAEHGKLANIEETLLDYRVTGENISLVNQNTRRDRFHNFYRIFLSRQFPQVKFSEHEIRLHFLFSNGVIYDVKMSEMEPYLKKISHAIYSRYGKIAEVKNILKIKYSKLGYSIADRSPVQSFKFACKFNVLSISLMRYIMIRSLKRKTFFI